MTAHIEVIRLRGVRYAYTLFKNTVDTCPRVGEDIDIQDGEIRRQFRVLEVVHRVCFNTIEVIVKPTYEVARIENRRRLRNLP